MESTEKLRETGAGLNARNARGGASRPVRILVVYYSQSGDVERAVQSLVEPLEIPEVELTWQCLRPVVPFPSPWRNLGKFFNTFPECVALDPPEIEPLSIDPGDKFDLVILAYQVWFLSPSLPTQAFLFSPYARVLRGTKVLTLSVSRNMWHSAGETMKELIAEAGGKHIDNVVITHQGPAWATFITTTRALIWGKKDRLWGIFPEAGIREEEFRGLTRFGKTIAARLDDVLDPQAGSLLRGQGAVSIERRYVLPELFGWYLFNAWASAIRVAGKVGRPLRWLGVLAFTIFLVCAIVIGIPLLMVARLAFYPLLKAPLARYTARLQEPSGGLESSVAQAKPASARAEV